MNRPCFALSMMLAALASALWGVGQGHGGQTPAWTQHASRMGLCPLSAGEYFGCEYGVYAPPVAGRCPAARENWDFFDAEYETVEDLADGWRDADCDLDACPADAVDCPAKVDQVVDAVQESSVNNAGGHDRCLSGHDPAYDAAVYGVEADTPVAQDRGENESVESLHSLAERHVEADFEFTYDEYAAVYGVDELRGAHMYVAEFTAEDQACNWDDYLYENFPGYDDLYADDYQAYEYNCHYGRHHWSPCREQEDCEFEAARSLAAEANTADQPSDAESAMVAPVYSPQLRHAVERLARSPLAPAIRLVSGGITVESLAWASEVDWIAAGKLLVRQAAEMQREAVRQEMISYYGLDQDEYAWADANYFYENYYAIDFAGNSASAAAAGSGINNLQRLASGCGREVILDAADTLDQMGAVLKSASKQLTRLTETR